MNELTQVCPQGDERCALLDHDTQIDLLMDKEACREKHKWSTWAFGVLFALMSLFLALSGVALASSNAMNSRVGDIQLEMTSQLADSDKTLEVYMARQEEANKALMATLESMRNAIDTNTETLKNQSEQIILQNQILQKLLVNDE